MARGTYEIPDDFLEAAVGEMEPGYRAARQEKPQ
jgi:hypothetical protein